MPISKNKTLLQKRDLLISGRFRYHKITTENNHIHTPFNHSLRNADVFPVVASLPPKNRTFIWVSQANLTKTPSATPVQQILCNMFSSKSFVKTVTLQLFRTSNLLGFLYVAALLFWASFHCYFACSLFSQPIPMRLPSIHQTMWSLARPQTFRKKATPHLP